MRALILAVTLAALAGCTSTTPAEDSKVAQLRADCISYWGGGKTTGVSEKQFWEAKPCADYKWWKTYYTYRNQPVATEAGPTINVVIEDQRRPTYFNPYR
jgi:hypothetical protein